MNRRECLHMLQGLGLWSLTSGLSLNSDAVLKRTIPSSGEQLPAVGLGTWQTFDAGNSSSERDPLKEVLKNLIEKGGRVVDSSPMYGRSQAVVGELSTAAKLNEKLFIATKVWTTGRDSGIQQMNDAFELLKRKNIDLLQIHNLVDWQTHIKTLRAWKEEGRIKYIGLTHYLDSMHDTIAGIISKEKVDFIQVNFNLLNRHAAERLLPFAQEKGVAVLINRPFQEGALFNHVREKTLPVWAVEFDCHNWAQFFLKFILSHPAVTCPIPGTSNPLHMLENIGAALGKLPDEKQRQEMIKVVS
jgi:diketogulonate reductase-like aldo/keto reductase